MMGMSRAAFAQRLVVESPDLIRLHLREGVQAVQHKLGEIILDLNRSGNWIRGIEIVGGFVPFSIAKAVSPFNPVRPSFPKVPEPGTVTYDPEADATFVYLEYDHSFNRLSPHEQAELRTVSHSVSPTAKYGLDEVGGLVWVKIPIGDAGPADRFLQLLRKG